MIMTNWDELRQVAIDAMKMAYVPYSGFPVGAAGQREDGQIFSGCNVENAGYGVTLCAECGMISDLVKAGGGKLAAFLCVNGNEELTSPCGRCRQLLWEHGTATTQIMLPEGIISLPELLPYGFGVSDLAQVERK
ncbi:cytidine deaminase [Flaviflexus massiliensis]|uniref:cytidine deaminase n=1 Tax=Flaviflexus massiliensis TaxID=1522309 RepID=UPI0006D56B95